MSDRDARRPLTSPSREDEDRPASLSGRRVSSTVLFQGHDEIVILHRAREYRLRITKADKLILTK